MKFKFLAATLLFAVSAQATANVKMEMFQMNRQVGMLIHAENAEEFKAGAERFIQAAKAAKEKMPMSLEGDQTRFEGYQKAMQELIDTTQQAADLAEQGKLDEAKEIAKQLNQLKKVGHSEYKK